MFNKYQESELQLEYLKHSGCQLSAMFIYSNSRRATWELEPGYLALLAWLPSRLAAEKERFRTHVKGR